MFTTAGAAKELGVTRTRVLAMIAAGRLVAVRYGREWLIKEKDLNRIRERKPGRPPKKKRSPGE